MLAEQGRRRKTGGAGLAAQDRRRKDGGAAPFLGWYVQGWSRLRTISELGTISVATRRAGTR